MWGSGAKIALVAWVATLLVAPSIGYALGVQGKNIENRALARGPGWSLHTLTHSSAWHHAADAFSDHMPFRDTAIRWRAETEFNVFRDSPRPAAVIVGRDRWLFLREEFGTCEEYPDGTALQVAQAFDLAHAAAAASGRELYTLIVPAKSSVEAEHYRGSQYTFETCPRARERSLEQLLRGKPGVIDLWSAFRDAKRAGNDLWIPNDSHTDAEGSIVIARAVVKAIRPAAWQEGLEQSGAPVSYVGDLDVLAGIEDSTQRHDLIVHGAPRDPIRRPLLQFGDSQLAVADQAIAPYVPTRQTEPIDAMLFGSVKTETIRAARLIVVETVQRTAYQRVLGFFYPLRLIDAFLPDIHDRLPAAYGDHPEGTALTLAAGVSTVPLRSRADQPGSWRLVLFTVMQAPAPPDVALLDVAGQPRTSPDSARGQLPAGSLIALAIPPAIPLADVRLSVSAPAGATLSPLQIAPLP
jgi:hypothetical protein